MTKKYADLISYGVVPWKESEGRVERILINETNEEEIRFCWRKGNRFMTRPLDLTEDDLLKLMKDALDKGVFTGEFRQRLKAIL